MTLGAKLQRLRKARSWTQEELAEKVGVSRQSLSKWESDSALPDTANIIVLADLFGVTTDYLLREGTPEPFSPQDTPAVIQLVPSKKQAPPSAIVLGCILFVLGLLGWIALQIAQAANPCTYYLDDQVFRGLQGYIRTYHMQAPYYASIAAMVIGAMILAVCFLRHLLHWLLQKADDGPASP